MSEIRGRRLVVRFEKAESTVQLEMADETWSVHKQIEDQKVGSWIPISSRGGRFSFGPHTSNAICSYQSLLGFARSSSKQSSLKMPV